MKDRLNIALRDMTPRRRRRGRLIPVALIALLGALLLGIAIGGVQWAASKQRAPKRPGVSWVELQVAQQQQWAATASAVVTQAQQLARARGRIDQLCATLDVLVGMTPGRARLPRVVEDACEPPLPTRTSAHLWGGGR